MKALILVILALALVVSGCNTKFFQSGATEKIQDVSVESAREVARLPLLNMSSVDSFKKYKEFADSANTLITILNETGDGVFDIPQLEVTMESFEKASRIVTEYGPLINNYNEVVRTARAVNEGKGEIEEFYKASGIFGFELAIIYWAVFYGASYQSVGIVYRAVGLNRLAPKCGTCIRSILSSAHWTIREALVEGSSKAAESLIDAVGKLYEGGTPKSVDEAVEFIRNSMGN